MDWMTAWRALLPVYALAVGLHALFPLFAVPIWVIFGIYGFKVLASARMAEDPWRGRGSPRAYLVSFVPMLVLNFLVLLTASPSSLGGLLLYWLSFLLSMGLAAGFVAASAPPNVRKERALMRGGVVAELGSAFIASGLAASLLPGGPSDVALLLGAFGLAVLSFAIFTYAGLRARSRTTAVARRLRRTGG